MASSNRRYFESMTVIQLQEYLRMEGVEPPRNQLKKVYVDLAYQQSQIASGLKVAPQTRWGSEPVQLRTSPIRTASKEQKSGIQPVSEEQPQMASGLKVAPQTRWGSEPVALRTSPIRRASDRGSGSQPVIEAPKRLKSPERGRSLKCEGEAIKSPRRMREMSPLRRAKSPLRNKGMIESKSSVTTEAPKTLSETLLRQTISPQVQAEVSHSRTKTTSPARIKKEKREPSSFSSVWSSSKRGFRKAAQLVWSGTGRLLRHRPPSWLLMPLGFGLAMLVALMYLRAALRPVPFCDTGVTPTGKECIACPEHGFCEAGQLECAVGYERVGRHCVKDKRVEARVQKLAGRVKRFVCTQRGLALCGYNATEAVARVDAVRMLGEGQALDQQTAGVFALAVQRASDELLTAAIDGVPVLICPNDLAQRSKPWGCLATEAARRHWRALAVLTLCILCALRFWHRRRQRQALMRHAEVLFGKICAELEDAANRTDASAKWVMAAHFRDTLLKPRERNGPLWREVERLAVEDSRVNVRQQMVRGESRTVWEWLEAGAPLSPTFKSRTPGTDKGEAQVRRRPSGETPSRANGPPSRLYPSTSTINTDPIRWRF